jgi:hypothetical protein
VEALVFGRAAMGETARPACLTRSQLRAGRLILHDAIRLSGDVATPGRTRHRRGAGAMATIVHVGDAEDGSIVCAKMD